MEGRCEEVNSNRNLKKSNSLPVTVHCMETEVIKSEKPLRHSASIQTCAAGASVETAAEGELLVQHDSPKDGKMVSNGDTASNGDSESASGGAEGGLVSSFSKVQLESSGQEKRTNFKFGESGQDAIMTTTTNNNLPQRATIKWKIASADELADFGSLSSNQSSATSVHNPIRDDEFWCDYRK